MGVLKKGDEKCAWDLQNEVTNNCEIWENECVVFKMRQQKGVRLKYTRQKNEREIYKMGWQTSLRFEKMSVWYLKYSKKWVWD